MSDLDIANAHLFVQNNKLVANVKGHEEIVDGASEVAKAAHGFEAEWDKTKPAFRQRAIEIVDKMAILNTHVQTVNLLGTENRIVEVAMSDRRKDVSGSALEQAKTLQSGLGSELVTEEVELTIKGNLAVWLLDKMKDHIGNPEMVIKKRHVLLPKFEEVRRNVNAAKTLDPSFKQICEVLAVVGIYAPSVECKTLKVK